MKRFTFLLALLSFMVLFSCKNEAGKDSENMEDTTTIEKTEPVREVLKQISIRLEAKSGSQSQGKVAFIEQNGTVTMEAVIIGLEPGTHAIHLHEKADCSAEDGTSSGGHWNPTFEPHGAWGAEEGYHKGDIGNFEVDETGTGNINFSTDQWCIGCGDEKKDILGKAVIVHKGSDDFTTQPTGNAGARVSCGGVIE